MAAVQAKFINDFEYAYGEYALRAYALPRQRVTGHG